MNQLPTAEQRSEAAQAICGIRPVLLQFESAADVSEETHIAEASAKPVIDRFADLFRALACGEIQADRAPLSARSRALAVLLATPWSTINAAFLLKGWEELFGEALAAKA